MIGQIISHYKILEKLGEGGMGVVYKAQDTKLDRFVALKFLPAHATINAETKGRFTQEAKAAASLNHPNICTIHGVDEIDGNLFIVMEYIDGGTLREKLPYTKVDDAVSIAIQIGEALHEAHSKGIVHRDVKADNIMLTSKGQIKVMDFGLAKLKGSLKLTRTSSTVGTLAYMAPEQIQGGEVDQRSDIFSFGVLFFEMLTGKFPFRGEHEAALLYSIVNEDPESITKYIPDASSGLQNIFEKALEKDPAVRYHSADEMVVDLRRTKKQTSRVSKIISIPSEGSQPNIAVQKKDTPKNSKMYIRLGAVVGLIAIALIVYTQFFNKENLSVPFTTMKLTRLTTDGKASDATISFDGRLVAYIRSEKEKNNLWLRQVSTTTNAPITQPSEDNIWSPTFSPNGDFLYYGLNKQGTNKTDLYQISVLGGNQRLVMSHINSRVTFSPAGKQFAFLTDSLETVTHLIIADVNGANKNIILRRKAPEHFDDLAWSPDGKYIGLIEGKSGSFMNHRILVYSVDDKKEIVPLNQKWLRLMSILWVDNSKGFIVSAVDDQSSFDSPQLWYFPFPNGTARKITNDLNGYYAAAMDRHSTQLAALEFESFSNLQLLINNSVLSLKSLTEGTKKHDGMTGVKWFNNDQIIFSSQSSGNDNIWITNEQGGGETQITSGAFVDRSPFPIPQKNAIIFSSNRSGSFNIWRCDVNGSNLQQLSHGNYEIEPLVSPDGLWIVYGSFGDSASSIMRMTANGDSVELLTSKHVQSHAISPDSKYLAFVYFNAEQKQKLAVISISTKEIIKEIEFPHTIRSWTPDGKGFAYIDTKNEVSNIWSQPMDGGKPKQLTDFKTGHIFSFDWTRDGRKLIIARGESSTDVVLLTDTDKVPQ
jgi:serine/threonine protein kinase